MQTHDDLAAILAASTFQIVPGTYVYAKAVMAPPVHTCFMVSIDQDEITVVAEADQLRGIQILERTVDSYALIALHVSAPSGAVGFLASVTAALAQDRIDVLVVSTYSKDYVLVRQDRVGDAAECLRELGLKRFTATECESSSA